MIDNLNKHYLEAFKNLIKIDLINVFSKSQD